MKEILKNKLNKKQVYYLKELVNKLYWVVGKPLMIYNVVMTPLRIYKNTSKKDRKLEIGTGNYRISGFETLNIASSFHVDYILDASKKLPFKDESFSLIYTSHIVEHLPWFKLEEILTEWYRIIEKDGMLEIFVPDGLKICKAFVDAEEGNDSSYTLDGWYKFNESKDPCIWANGRIFSYGDGTVNKMSPNWHMSLFSERFLTQLLKNIGFRKIVKLTNKETRGYNHGWINLGLRATK
jgi:SAM-dependent methyltransferase